MFGRNEANKIHKKGANSINMIKMITKSRISEKIEKCNFMIYFDKSWKVSLATTNCFRLAKMKTKAKIMRTNRKIIAPAVAFEMLYP